MRSYLFRDYGFSILGLALALGALAIVGTTPAKPHPSGNAWAHSGAANFEMMPLRVAAMQPGTDAGSTVGDRAGQVHPSDLKAGGVRNGGDTGQKPTPRAVDARKTSDGGPVGDWRAHLAPS